MRNEFPTLEELNAQLENEETLPTIDELNAQLENEETLPTIDELNAQLEGEETLPTIDELNAQLETPKRDLGVWETLKTRKEAQFGKEMSDLETAVAATPYARFIYEMEQNRNEVVEQRLYDKSVDNPIELRKLGSSIGLDEAEMDRLYDEADSGLRTIAGFRRAPDMEVLKEGFRKLVEPRITARVKARQEAQEKLNNAEELGFWGNAALGTVEMGGAALEWATPIGVAAETSAAIINRTAELGKDTYTLDENGKAVVAVDEDGNEIRGDKSEWATVKAISGGVADAVIWNTPVVGKMLKKSMGGFIKKIPGYKEFVQVAGKGAYKKIDKLYNALTKSESGRILLKTGGVLAKVEEKLHVGSLPNMMLKSRVSELVDDVVGLRRNEGEKKDFAEWLTDFVSVDSNVELLTGLIGVWAISAGGSFVKARGDIKKFRHGEGREEKVAEYIGKDAAKRLSDKDLDMLYRIVSSENLTTEKVERFLDKVKADRAAAEKLIAKGKTLEEVSEAWARARELGSDGENALNALKSSLEARRAINPEMEAKLDEKIAEYAEGQEVVAKYIKDDFIARLKDNRVFDDPEMLDEMVAMSARRFEPESIRLKVHDIRGTSMNEGRKISEIENLGVTDWQSAEQAGLTEKDRFGRYTGGAVRALNVMFHGTTKLQEGVKSGTVSGNLAENLLTAATCELGGRSAEERGELIDGILDRSNGDEALANAMIRRLEADVDLNATVAEKLDRALTEAKAEALKKRNPSASTDEVNGALVEPVEKPDGTITTTGEFVHGEGGANTERPMPSTPLEGVEEAPRLKGVELTFAPEGELKCQSFPEMRVKVSADGVELNNLSGVNIADPARSAEFAAVVAQVVNIAKRNGLQVIVKEEHTPLIQALVREIQSAGLAKTQAKLDTRSKLFSLLFKTTLGTGVTYDEKSFVEALERSSNGRRLVNNHGDIYGFVDSDDVLHFNPAVMNFNTPIHEYGHLALDAVRKINPKLWEQGKKLIRDSEYYRSIVEQSNDAENPYSWAKGNDDAICDEALATMIGDRGEKLVLDRGVDSKLKAWLKEVWKAFKGAFGLADLTDEQIEKMTLEEFVDTINAELLSGREFGTKKKLPPSEKSVKRYDEAEGSGSNGLLRWRNDRGYLFAIPVDMERTQPGGKVVFATDDANITDWIQSALNGYDLRLSKSGKLYVKGRNGLPDELALIFGRFPTAGMNDGIMGEIASAVGNAALNEMSVDDLVNALKSDRANYDAWAKAKADGKSLEEVRQEEHYADEAAREEAERKARWENSGMGILDYIRSRMEDGDPEFDLDWEIAREMANDRAESRFSVGGVYTGSAADYANRSRQGGVDDGPSLVKIGSGEGAQVYGWGLYGSTVRGVAEGYAKQGAIEKGKFRVDEFGDVIWADVINSAKRNGRPIEKVSDETSEEDFTIEQSAALWIWLYGLEGAKRNAEKILNNDFSGNWPYQKKYKALYDELQKHGQEYTLASNEHLYEQTFFTDRAPGDESHLLKWYEPVSKENAKRIAEQLKKENVHIGIDMAKLVENYDKMERITEGRLIYQKLVENLYSPKAASEFLARADIDGVKYPVDSYGGKGVKDGDEVGWNYVSFRDDNIRVDHKWTDGVARFSARPAMSALAKAKVGESVEGITVDSLRNAIKTKIENGLSEGEFRFKKPEDRSRLVSEAVRFYKRFSQKTVMLSDGRCVYFVPDARAKAERGLTNDEAWAEYAIHAVTSSGQKISGKNWNERLYNKTKAANIWRIENILKAERCKLQEETNNQRGGIAFYGRGVDGKVIRIITRLDEADNIYADLAEVTVVTDRKEKVLPPRKPLAEVVGAARKRGDLLADDNESLPQNAASAQARFSIASPAEDAAYLNAVKRGDMETAQKLLKSAWERSGYSPDRGHLDAHAAPSAPIDVIDFKNKKALTEAREEGWDLNLWAIANGITGQPGDFFSEQGPRLYMYDDKAGREAQKEIAKAISMVQAGLKTRVNVYRAVPKSVKSDLLQSGGEWVSPSRTYAETHGEMRFGEGEYRIIEETVLAEHLWWDGNDAREWGFDDGRQYVYANAQNGSKLATVTYDNDGNVIPLSQRFDAAKRDVRFHRGGVLKRSGKDGKIVDVDQQRLTAVMRGLETGELKHPRFTREEFAASKGVRHERLWSYLLSLESPDIHAGGGQGLDGGKGGNDSQGSKGMGLVRRVATRYGSNPEEVIASRHKYFDKGVESKVYVTGGDTVIKVRKLNAYDLDGVKHELAKIVYHNYLFPNDAYTLRDIAVWNKNGYDQFYLIVEQPLVRPKTDANGNIIAPSEEAILKALNSAGRRFSQWDEAWNRRAADVDDDLYSSDDDFSSDDFVASGRKMAYNDEFVVYDFKPGRNTFIDAETGEIRFIDPRVDINDPSAGFSVSKFGKRKIDNRSMTFDGSPSNAGRARFQYVRGVDWSDITMDIFKFVPEGTLTAMGETEQSAAGLAGAIEKRGALRPWTKAESPADRAKPIAFDAADMVMFWRAVSGSLRNPHVQKGERIKGRPSAIGLNVGGDRIEIVSKLFGVIDESDIKKLREDCRAEGYFRNENTDWCAANDKGAIEDERLRSQAELDRRTRELYKTRVETGAGGEHYATQVLGHEIGHTLGLLPTGAKLGKAGDAMRTLYEAFESELKRQTSGLRVKRGEDNLSKEIGKLIAWWHGTESMPEYYAKPKEKFAELFGIFLTQPESVQSQAPKAYDLCVKLIAGNEKLTKAYQTITSLKWDGKSNDAVMAEVRKTWDKEAQDQYRELVKLTKESISLKRDEFNYALNDRFGPMFAISTRALKAEKKLLDEAVRTGAMSEAEAADRYKAKQNEINALKTSLYDWQRQTGGQTRLIIAQFDDVKAQAEKDGVNWNDVRTYAHNMRVIELGGRATAHAVDPARASAILDEMRQKLGDEKYLKVEKTWKAYRAVYEKAVLDDPNVRELFDADTMKMLEANKHYVTMRHRMGAEETAEWLEKIKAYKDGNSNAWDPCIDIQERLNRGLGSTAGESSAFVLYHLVGSFEATEDPLAATIRRAIEIKESAARNHLLKQTSETLRALGAKGVFDKVAGSKATKVDPNVYGRLFYMDGGVKHELIVPKVIHKSFKAESQNALPGFGTAMRAIRNTMTLWNPMFVNRAYLIDKSGLEANIKGLHKAPIDVLSEALCFRGIGVPLYMINNYLARFTPICNTWIGKLLWNENTANHYAHKAQKIARIVYEGRFAERLEEARQLRALGETGRATEIEENVAIAQEMMRRNIFQSAYSFNKQQAGFDTDEIMRQFGYRIDGGKDPKSWKSKARNLGRWWTRFGEEQEAVTKIIAYLYELKKGTSAEEASRIAIERGGTPNLAARGVAASYIENATGFFWNVRKEATLRTLRAIKDHPTEWITKNFAQTAMPAFLKCMIITGGLEMIIRAMFDDDEEKIQNSWWAGEVVNYARFMNSAMKCVPGYYQRNYNIIPIAKFGDEVLSMRIKYSPEEFAIQNAIHTAFQKFGADPTDPDADWSSFNREMLSQITPDIFGGNYALDLSQILIGPIIGYNPYDRYRQRNVYDNSTWEARWSAPGNMVTKMVTNFANYSPFGSFVTRFKDGQEQKIEDSDVPTWLDAVLQTPLLSRIPASMLSITSSDSYLKALANVDGKQKAYARIVAGDLLAECIENGRLGGFEEGLKDLLPELKRLAIRHVLNGWRQYHMDPNAKKLRTMRRIKDPNLKRKARKWIEDAEKYGD